MVVITQQVHDNIRESHFYRRHHGQYLGIDLIKLMIRQIRSKHSSIHHLCLSVRTFCVLTFFLEVKHETSSVVTFEQMCINKELYTEMKFCLAPEWTGLNLIRFYLDGRCREGSLRIESICKASSSFFFLMKLIFSLYIIKVNCRGKKSMSCFFTPSECIELTA